MTSRDMLFNMSVVKRVKTKQVSIMWTDDEDEGVLCLYEDTIVIKASIASKEFDQILVDSGSSVDILFKSTLDEIGITDVRLEHTSAS